MSSMTNLLGNSNSEQVVPAFTQPHNDQDCLLVLRSRINLNIPLLKGSSIASNQRLECHQLSARRRSPDRPAPQRQK
jgi:hypothetical protein